MTGKTDSRPLFYAAMLLIPLVFFCLVEGALRLSGFGEDNPLFVEVPGYSDYLVPNPEVGRRYFARTSVVPAPMHDAFRRAKGHGTLRIVVQGASTAAGFPYGHGGSFSRMLEQRLQQTFPDREIEVINTAMAAVNSYTLVDLAREIIAQQADVVLIYAGHNEYYGALGVGSTESLGRTRAAVRLYLSLDNLRIVQGLRGMLVGRRARSSADAAGAPGATLMEEMARERTIPFGSSLYDAGVAQFAANMEALLCAYRDAGIPVLIGTIASNERGHAPFDGGPSPAADAAFWSSRMEGARQATAQGDTAGALQALESLIRLDSIAAEPFFRRARLHEAAGRYDEARHDYRAATDRDRLRFRAPEAMNSVIRRTAAACRAKVVETQAALTEASPSGIIGDELMLEHLHPNVDGYFLLADAYYEALLESIADWQPDTPPEMRTDHRSEGADGMSTTDMRAEPRRVRVPAGAARRSVLVTELDSLLAEYHVRRLKNNWPFQPPGVTRPDTIRISTAAETLALEVLQGRKSWLEATAALGAHLEASGNYGGALRAALALIQEEPYRAQPYLLAGHLLIKQQRFNLALPYLRAAEAREPSFEAKRMVGHALVRTGRFAEAINVLENAIGLDSRDEAALYDLAVAYLESGRQADASRTAERLLRLNPRHPGGHRLAARLP